MVMSMTPRPLCLVSSRRQLFFSELGRTCTFSGGGAARGRGRATGALQPFITSKPRSVTVMAPRGMELFQSRTFCQKPHKIHLYLKSVKCESKRFFIFLLGSSTIVTVPRNTYFLKKYFTEQIFTKSDVKICNESQLVSLMEEGFSGQQRSR